MYPLIRALLFLLDAERSHDLSIAALRVHGALPLPIRPAAGRRRRVMGLDFDNPVGLAAGLDKNAVAAAGLARLGFGFVEVGTVTPRPQPGNPRPRLFRLPAERALINRMGFNNDGIDAMCERLATLRRRNRASNTRIGVNIGKNKDTPNAVAVDDYLAGLRGAHPFADYITVNLSSPNTPGLRALQTGDDFVELLRAVMAEKSELDAAAARRVPIAVKIAPDLEDADVVRIADVLRTLGVDGVIATNTTLDRSRVAGHPLAGEAGGLSGEPLFERARGVVEKLVRELDGALPVIAVGGISSTITAQQMLDVGADLFQIYTSFIYKGPALVRELANL